MYLPREIPNPDDLLALAPEELAGYLLAHLNTSMSRRTFGRSDFTNSAQFAEAWGDKLDACREALMEAWMVLEREALVAPEPGNQYAVYFITRRGKSLQSVADYRSFRQASQFPKGTIHPTIEQLVYPTFLRGDYETAIFQAFKEVEARVRSMTPGLDAKLYGTDLMRKAFQPNGPLALSSEPVAEQEALQALFAGAIGRFKNPASHRHVPITSPTETLELLQLASHLLRVLDDRTP